LGNVRCQLFAGDTEQIRDVDGGDRFPALCGSAMEKKRGKDIQRQLQTRFGLRRGKSFWWTRVQPLTYLPPLMVDFPSFKACLDHVQWQIQCRVHEAKLRDFIAHGFWPIGADFRE